MPGGPRPEPVAIAVMLPVDRAEARRRTEAAFREEQLPIAEGSDSDVITTERVSLTVDIFGQYRAALSGADSGTQVELSGSYATDDLERPPWFQTGGVPLPPRGKLSARMRGKLGGAWARLERIAARLEASGR